MLSLSLWKGRVSIQKRNNILEFSNILPLLPFFANDDIERERPLNAKQKSGALKVKCSIKSDKR